MEARRAHKKSFYSILGVSKNASASEIRNAYRKLAMKWHPDKCSSEQAKKVFQEIQEAYSVLSDEGKRAMYDLGLYDAHDEDEDIRGLSSFLSEMSTMMVEVKAESQKLHSLVDLQNLFANMFHADLDMWRFSMSGGEAAATSKKCMKQDDGKTQPEEKKKREQYVGWSNDEWEVGNGYTNPSPRLVKKKRTCG